MIEFKPVSIPMDLGIPNSLFSYDRNTNKKTIK